MKLLSCLGTKWNARSRPREYSRDFVSEEEALANWRCPRIAQQIMLAFSVEIDKDVVRRILSVHYLAGIGFGRPFLAHVPWPHEGQFVELRFVPM